LKIDAPRAAALVRNPERSEWLARVAGSSPTRAACALMMAAMLRSVSLAARTRSPLAIGRNTTPWSAKTVIRARERIDGLSKVCRSLTRAPKGAGTL
jgi:hypothetical protein